MTPGGSISFSRAFVSRCPESAYILEGCSADQLESGRQNRDAKISDLETCNEDALDSIFDTVMPIFVVALPH
jgi:hypothetical protein